MRKRERVLAGDRCQCGACGEYFGSTYAFDKHRTTKSGMRVCRWPSEMLRVGMVINARGWWVGSAANMPAEVLRLRQLARFEGGLLPV